MRRDCKHHGLQVAVPDRGVEQEPLAVELLPQLVVDQEAEPTGTPAGFHRDRHGVGAVDCSLACQVGSI